MLLPFVISENKPNLTKPTIVVSALFFRSEGATMLRHVKNANESKQNACYQNDTTVGDFCIYQAKSTSNFSSKTKIL